MLNENLTDRSNVLLLVFSTGPVTSRNCQVLARMGENVRGSDSKLLRLRSQVTCFERAFLCLEVRCAVQLAPPLLECKRRSFKLKNREVEAAAQFYKRHPCKSPERKNSIEGCRVNL